MKSSSFWLSAVFSIAITSSAVAQSTPAAPAGPLAPTAGAAPAGLEKAPVIGAASDVKPSISDSYMTRYRPTAGLVELGIFGGVMFPSHSHALEEPGALHREFAPGGELGLRLGYFPIDLLGVEAEAASVSTSVKGGSGAGIWAGGGHAILQLTGASITPFVLVGGGALGANSREMGKDTDFAFHWGAGVKLALDSFLSARLDVRDTMSKSFGSIERVVCSQSGNSAGVDVHAGQAKAPSRQTRRSCRF